MRTATLRDLISLIMYLLEFLNHLTYPKMVNLSGTQVLEYIIKSLLILLLVLKIHLGFSSIGKINIPKVNML